MPQGIPPGVQNLKNWTSSRPTPHLSLQKIPTSAF
nr:MAG TPA: hypothetical protein [Caudoviricetes sp.]